MNIVNLNSRFDWTNACTAIVGQAIERLPSVDIGVEATEWRKAACCRMSNLKWLFLVDDLCMQSQEEKCPRGDDTEQGNDRDESPTFQRRQGGKNQEQSFINRRPIQLTGGGVVEPLGVYVSRARAFAEGAFLLPELQRKRPASAESKSEDDTLAALLPPSVGNEPAIFISPERLFRLPLEMANALNEGEPHPGPDRNWTELMLRMTIIHEIGHHLLPAPPEMSTVVSEALANWFCASFLSEDERPWLFAKAWLLQPSMYLAWFVPITWEKAGLTALLQAWSMTIRSSLGISASAVGSAGRALTDDHWSESPMERSGIPMSPQVRHAFTAMVQALSGSGHGMHMRMELDMMLRHSPVCEWGPFEEHAVIWSDVASLLPLLGDSRPTVAAAAYRMLDRGHASSSLDMDAHLNPACDQFLATDNQILAQAAWYSSRARRNDGIEARFLDLLESPHTSLAENMLSSYFRSHFPADRQEAVLRQTVQSSGRVTAVRAAAAGCLAEILCEAKRASKADWEWLIGETNYLVYEKGFTRTLEFLRGGCAIPPEVMYAAAQPLKKTIEYQAKEQCLKYDEQTKLKERLDKEQFDMFLNARNALRWTGVDGDAWPREFMAALYAAALGRIKTVPASVVNMIKVIPDCVRSYMLLHSCDDKQWKFAELLLDFTVNLDWAFTTSNGDKMKRDRNAFHLALAGWDAQASLITRMAELPDALETKNGDGMLPIEIAMEGRSDAMKGLLKLSGKTRQRLLDVVVRNNCDKGLKELLKHWKLTEEERRSLQALAEKSGSNACMAYLC